MKIIIKPYLSTWYYLVNNRVGQPIFMSFHKYNRKSDCVRAAENVKKYLKGKVEIEVLD